MVELNVLTNYVDADVDYATTPADYIIMDLANDYLIWSEGDDVVKDLMTHEPTPAELNSASVIIDPDDDKEVPLCLLMDYSHDVGGAYYTHEVKGIGENKRFVFGFSFNGATASEPQLEAWDDSTHTTKAKHVLGSDTPADSFIKGVVTTVALPGVDWTGISLAGNGSSNILLLNAGNGALDALGSGETSQELYANLKLIIPQNYATPAVETYILCTRFCWN